MKRVLKIDEWFHPDGFPISIERREPQEEFEPHAHEFAELVIVTGGKGLHVTGRDSWELTAGDVFVISGPREHHYRDLRDLRLVNILYQPDGRALLRLGEALSHLERNIQNAVNLEELANIAHMSRRSFLRIFQSATGTSPLAWLIERRIERACGMLRHSDKRVTEIAFEVGFNDSNYFTRQFRKTTGLSPREYRLRQGLE